MSDIYKLQYGGMTLAYPGWNGYVCYEAAPAYKTLTLCASNGGTLTADTITGMPGDTIELAPTYDTYWRLSGYAKAGDGTLSNNTYTFGEDDEQIVSAYFKPNAFTATGTFNFGTLTLNYTNGGVKTASNVGNAIVNGFTGGRPSNWPANGAAWNVTNASSYSVKTNTNWSYKNHGNGAVACTGAIRIAGSNKVSFTGTNWTNKGTKTADCSLSWNSTQGQLAAYGNYSARTIRNIYNVVEHECLVSYRLRTLRRTHGSNNYIDSSNDTRRLTTNRSLYSRSCLHLLENQLTA